MAPHYFFVGTFNSPNIYTISFDPSTSRLSIESKAGALGYASWLAFRPNKRNLYTTSWVEPFSVASYKVGVGGNGPVLSLVNAVPISGHVRSGYVCASDTTVYSVGGPNVDVFPIDKHSGTLKSTCQTLSLREGEDESFTGTGTMDFGGLRYGAHSIDLSPDGRTAYVADLGERCIWSYRVDGNGALKLSSKTLTPRPNDGPRHAWPHPSGTYLYCIEEHTSMVDAFVVAPDGTSLRHEGAVRVLPESHSAVDYWADEVRTSAHKKPRYLYATNRGMKSETKGYVAVFGLREDGAFASTKPLAMWETPTSGGIANAVQPGPIVDSQEYLALTDSEESLIVILVWDGEQLEEVARIKLGEGEKPATAVWFN